jgi:hypothetical protein
VDTTRQRSGRFPRRRLLAGAAAVGVAGTALYTVTRSDEPVRRSGVRYRGVCYTVSAGEIPATAWSAERMRTDVRAIRTGLRANSIKVTGDGVERLTATAEAAVGHGLQVRSEPTLGDQPERDILEHLAEVGRHAEELRRHGADVELSVGCECYLFVPGIVPGADSVERVTNLGSGNFDPVQVQRGIAEFLERAAATGRAVFRGPLSYAAAQGDEVDWDLFDVVGLDYYANHRRRADHVRELRGYLKHGKPLAIAEFGSCTYEGAPDAGGMGWNLVDYTASPPRISRPLRRSERTQADYLTGVFDVVAELGLRSAHAFEFVTPDAPHRPGDPSHDLDLVSYGIVKPIQDRPDDPSSPWHWEPKAAFHALARRYADAERRDGA